MCSDRGIAAAPDSTQPRSLALNLGSGAGIVDLAEAGNDAGVLGAAAHGDRTLADLREHLNGREHVRRPIGHRESHERRHGDNDGTSRWDLAEARRHVAPQLGETKIRPQPRQLRPPPHGPARHEGACSQL
jgi:hypothetical protein